MYCAWRDTWRSGRAVPQGGGCVHRSRQRVDPRTGSPISCGDVLCVGAEYQGASGHRIAAGIALIPIMKFDATLGLAKLSQAATIAQTAETLGIDGLWSME